MYEAGAGTRVVHIITGLGRGGAEGVLYRLLAHQDREVWPSTVVSLTAGGEMAARISMLGVEVLSLGMRPGRVRLRAFFRLVRFLRERRPDVVQTWMYHANVMGGVAARFAGIKAVYWGLRHTHLDPARDKRSTILVARIGGYLSRVVPKRIICCSQSTYTSHKGYGYAESRMTVIPNGYDLARFRPDAGAATALRSELELGSDIPLIGMAARFHPLKDHRGFIQAARYLSMDRDDLHFVLCGERITPENEVLAGWIEDAGLGNRFHLLGVREDMPALYAGLDLAVLASHGEGFPNVVAESMACGTPTVATDVGDAAEIIGDAGWLVPPDEPEALAEAWNEALSLSEEAREELASRAIARIRNHYSIEVMVERYQELYIGAGIDEEGAGTGG